MVHTFYEIYPYKIIYIAFNSNHYIVHKVYAIDVALYRIIALGVKMLGVLQKHDANVTVQYPATSSGTHP